MTNPLIDLEVRGFFDSQDDSKLLSKIFCSKVGPLTILKIKCKPHQCDQGKEIAPSLAKNKHEPIEQIKGS